MVVAVVVVVVEVTDPAENGEGGGASYAHMNQAWGTSSLRQPSPCLDNCHPTPTTTKHGPKSTIRRHSCATLHSSAGQSPGQEYSSPTSSSAFLRNSPSPRRACAPFRHQRRLRRGLRAGYVRPAAAARAGGGTVDYVRLAAAVR